MKQEEVLQELLLILGSNGGGTLSWEQVQNWPKDAIEIFQNAGWIKPITSAKSVVCPGCEESCFMPVHVLPTVQGKPIRAFVACDKRDDMGNIPIPLDNLQQWQVTESQVAQWIARQLDLKGKPKKDKKSHNFILGDIQGQKQSSRLELVFTEPISLKISNHFLPLVEVLYFDKNEIQIDRETILRMVDKSSPSDQYQPSTARRETRKLDTQARNKSWQKAYLELKRKRSTMSDVWYSQQIAKMDIAQGRSAETIRKEMKK
jgi:hypothetical protein